MKVPPGLFISSANVSGESLLASERPLVTFSGLRMSSGYFFWPQDDLWLLLAASNLARVNYLASGNKYAESYLFSLCRRVLFIHCATQLSD